MIFELVTDLSTAVAVMPADHPKRRTLRLLEGALRRDVQFIARHPTTLFQCMWNTCWWYDSPEAAAHFEPPAGGWPPGEPPWKQASGKLCDVMEDWRVRRDANSPRPWIRLLRPTGSDPESGVRTVLRGHEGWVVAVASSEDGRQIASGSEDGTVCVWDLDDGQLRNRLHIPGGGVQDVAYAAGLPLLVAACEDGALRIVDAESGELVSCLPGHPRPHRNEEAFPQASMQMWAASGMAMLRCKGDVAVDCSMDGRLIASGADDQMVRVWDASTGEQLSCLSGHTGAVRSVAFSPDGRRLVSGSRDATVRIWDTESGRELRCLRGHVDHGTPPSGVFCARYSPDGRVIASGGGEWDTTLRVWDAETGEPLACLGGTEPSMDDAGRGANMFRAITSLAFSPDGTRVCCGYWDLHGRDSSVRVWDLQGGTLVDCLTGHTEPVTSVTYSRDGRWIVSGSKDKTVRIWSASGESRAMTLRGHRARVYKMAFSPDGRQLVTSGGSGDTSVLLWDVDSGMERRCLAQSGELVRSVAFSPDGQSVAGGGSGLDPTIRVWDTTTGEESQRFHGAGAGVSSLAFSPDGRHLVGGLEDGVIRVWDPETGEEQSCLSGHADDVRAVFFAEDGRSIVSAADDGTMRAWDASTGVPAQVWRGTKQLSDVIARASGYRFCARVFDTETCLFSLRTEHAIAWYPTAVDVMGHSATRTWVGAGGSHFALFRLEDSAPEDTTVRDTRSLVDMLVDASSQPVDASSPVTAGGWRGGPIPHPGADPKRAAQLNSEYQRRLAEWKALPSLRRLFTKPPDRPTGI